VREVETQLRRELSLVEPLRGGNLEVAKRIAAARNPVSLHLRRGDYGPFSVFSDDVASAKDWLRGDPRFAVPASHHCQQHLLLVGGVAQSALRQASDCAGKVARLRYHKDRHRLPGMNAARRRVAQTADARGSASVTDEFYLNKACAILG